MKKVVFVLMIFLFMGFVSAGDLFFSYYDENVFTAMKVFNSDLGVHEGIMMDEGLVYSSFDLPTAPLLVEPALPSPDHPPSDEVMMVEEAVVDEVMVNGLVEVNITKTDFEPKVVEIKVGQEVIWVNKRDIVKASIFGVREMSAMKSGFLQPGETFTWTFNEPGKFTYVDAVVIGYSGLIIVN